jgi:hypothetical protein
MCDNLFLSLWSTITRLRHTQTIMRALIHHLYIFSKNNESTLAQKINAQKFIKFYVKQTRLLFSLVNSLLLLLHSLLHNS